MYVRTLARKIVFLQPSNAASQLQDPAFSDGNLLRRLRTFCPTQNFLIRNQRAMCTPIGVLLLATCTAALAKDAEISPSVELREIFTAGEPNAHGFPVNS